MTRYSDNYSPAAPIAYVSLTNLDTSSTIHDVPMLLDTGSDITLLPLKLCRELGIEIHQNENIDLLTFDGSVATGSYVRLGMQFGGKQFRGNFVAFDHAEGILGRNVLNKFSILLDGPNLEWDLVAN